MIPSRTLGKQNEGDQEQCRIFPGASSNNHQAVLLAHGGRIRGFGGRLIVSVVVVIPRLHNIPIELRS